MLEHCLNFVGCELEFEPCVSVNLFMLPFLALVLLLDMLSSLALILLYDKEDSVSNSKTDLKEGNTCNSKNNISSCKTNDKEDNISKIAQMLIFIIVKIRPRHFDTSNAVLHRP